MQYFFDYNLIHYKYEYFLFKIISYYFLRDRHKLLEQEEEKKNKDKNKDKNDKKNLQNYSYEAYNKIELDVKNMSEKFMNRKVLKPFKFVFNNIDSISEEEPFLPLLLSENISNFYYTTKLNKLREVVKASKMSGVNDASFNEFLSVTYQDINVYDNAYTIIGKQFISPIANSCKSFYKYKVVDTLVLDNVVHYKMIFEPKTKGDNTFFGSFIVSENNYAIKNIQLRMAPHVNINFVKRIEVSQDYDFVGAETWMISGNQLLVEFKPLEKTPAIITRKNTIYKNFRINSRYNDSMISRLKEEVTINDNEVKKDQAFWDTSRFVQLTKNEAAVYHIIDTLKTVPAYKTYVDIIHTLLTGYFPVGPVELGPVLNTFSVNKLEGWRFGFGLRTNEKKPYRRTSPAWVQPKFDLSSPASLSQVRTRTSWRPRRWRMRSRRSRVWLSSGAISRARSAWKAASSARPAKRMMLANSLLLSCVIAMRPWPSSSMHSSRRHPDRPFAGVS